MFRVLTIGGEAYINFIEEKSEVRQEMDKMVAQPPFFLEIGKGEKISKAEFDQFAKQAGFSQVELTAKAHDYWYPTVDGYQRLEIIFLSLKKLSTRSTEQAMGGSETKT